MVVPDLRPRRLVLTAAELAVLYELTGNQLPSEFEVSASGEDHEAAIALLTEKGVLEAGQVHTSIAVNLSTLTAPELLIETRIHRAGWEEVRAIHAVSRVFGASLIRHGQRAVELSFFTATDIGLELSRVVPDLEGSETRMEQLFNLDALLHSAVVRTMAGASDNEMFASLGFSYDDQQTASWVACNVSGVLSGRVLTPPPSPKLGAVVWYATLNGWFGLRPELGLDGTRLMRLVPVTPREYTLWLQPYIAEALA